MMAPQQTHTFAGVSCNQPIRKSFFFKLWYESDLILCFYSFRDVWSGRTRCGTSDCPTVSSELYGTAARKAKIPSTLLDGILLSTLRWNIAEMYASRSSFFPLSAEGNHVKEHPKACGYLPYEIRENNLLFSRMKIQLLTWKFGNRPFRASTWKSLDLSLATKLWSNIWTYIPSQSSSAGLVVTFAHCHHPIDNR